MNCQIRTVCAVQTLIISSLSLLRQCKLCLERAQIDKAALEISSTAFSAAFAASNAASISIGDTGTLQKSLSEFLGSPWIN